MLSEDELGDSPESSDFSSTEHLSLEERISAKLERAIKTDDDAIIIRAWEPQYEQYEATQKFIPLIEQAQKRLVALEQFRSALKTNDDEKIVRSFDPILNGYSSIRSDEWQRLSEAVAFIFRSCNFGQGTDERWLQATLLRRFVDACRANDDESIVSAFHAIQDARYIFVLHITPQELDLVDRAERRIGVRQKFQEALRDGNLRQVANAYVLVVKNDVQLIPVEQEQAELATRFVYMFNIHEKDDESLVTAEEDAELVSIYEEIENSAHKQHLRFTPYEQERVQRAQHRMADLEHVREALKIGKPQEIVDVCAAAPLLNEKHLNADERAILRLAKRYVEAFRTHGNSANHPAVIDIYKEIAASTYSQKLYFTPQEVPVSSGKTSGDIHLDGSTPPDEMRLIATVAGIPIYNKQFQQVYLIKQQYIWLRLGQWQAMPTLLNDVWRWVTSQKGTLQDIQGLSQLEVQTIAQQVLDDIVDDFSMKKEINGLPREDKRKVEKQLHALYEEFKQRKGFLYQNFLQTNRLTDDEIKETLAIYARREFLTGDLVKRNQPPIDVWLISQRRNLVIEYPRQYPSEEQGGSGNWNPLRLIDWFGA